MNFFLHHHNLSPSRFIDELENSFIIRTQKLQGSGVDMLRHRSICFVFVFERHLYVTEINAVWF